MDCSAVSGPRLGGCGHEAAGDPGPWRQQAILGRTHWDAEALRDAARDYVVETLASFDAVLVIDETGYRKKGKAKGGVRRLYTGSAGKISNCQIEVFLIVGPMSVIRWAVRKGGSGNRWLTTLVTRKPEMVAAVALANKMARMIWVVTTKQEDYRMA
ncbi:DDE superfamily endonuclease [Methylobacterium sp. UNC300MFChir4.1]|nr:DDE superfamily endonuclease [Methylobacterium sp. UNC300MFChir4.1]